MAIIMEKKKRCKRWRNLVIFLENFKGAWLTKEEGE
jgi:hypothetical protein